MTINDDNNFGNRLQAFAMQQALSMLGYESELIRNSPGPMRRSLLAKRAWDAFRNDGPIAVAQRNGALFVNKLRRQEMPGPRYAAVRRAAIAAFADASLRSTNETFESLPADAWAARYTRVVVGSDQVWNHGFRNARPIDFLTFAPESRRLSYAASFGVQEVPGYLRQQYREWLNGIPHISVREQRGAEIVRELTGRSVPTVVDPTLLLTRQDWQPMQTLPSALAGRRYAVQFFLGDPTSEQLMWVRSLVAKRGLSLVDLNDLDSAEFADIDPGGFVAALAHADLVATDSFHAGVFSLLHHVPVVIRSRDQTDSRLNTLFDKHGITRRSTEVDGITTALEPDWQQADQRLAVERAASWDYLRESFRQTTTDES